MIQDIYPHHFSNAYTPDRKPLPDDIVFCVQGHSFLAKDVGAAPFPTYQELRLEQDPLFLFLIDDTAYYLSLSYQGDIPVGYSYLGIRELRRGMPMDKVQLFAAFTADHLGEWYRTNQHCGCCGHGMRPGKDERRMDCPSCGYRAYPRINPAVIVGVTNADKLLITHYAGRRGVAMPALVAGFAEIGETLEETVQREVMEEVGLKVKNIRYYKSQPWGIASDILAGFYCDVDVDPTIRVDESELADATWVKREDIVGQPDQLSLTNEMMLLFRDGKV